MKIQDFLSVGKYLNFATQNCKHTFDICPWSLQNFVRLFVGNKLGLFCIMKYSCKVPKSFCIKIAWYSTKQDFYR